MKSTTAIVIVALLTAPLAMHFLLYSLISDWKIFSLTQFAYSLFFANLMLGVLIISAGLVHFIRKEINRDRFIYWHLKNGTFLLAIGVLGIVFW
jgi:hypothetical protein